MIRRGLRAWRRRRRARWRRNQLPVFSYPLSVISVGRGYTRASLFPYNSSFRVHCESDRGGICTSTDSCRWQGSFDYGSIRFANTSSAQDDTAQDNNVRDDGRISDAWRASAVMAYSVPKLTDYSEAALQDAAGACIAACQA